MNLKPNFPNNNPIYPNNQQQNPHQINNENQEEQKQEIENQNKKPDFFSRENFKQIQQDTKEKLINAKNSMQNQFKTFQDGYKKMMSEKKQQIKEWFLKKVQVVVEKLLKKGRPGLKRYLKDPYMPLFAKDIVDDIVDETWPLVETNVMDMIGVVEITEENILEGVNKKPTTCQKINPWFWLRAFYCYTLQPYDKSIFYCLRNPFWYMFQLLKICPFYSINNYFYIFVFLAIDKTDEWQLVRYILEFKAFQFLSIGALQSIIGFVMFYNCATLNNYASEEESLECTKNGPEAQLWDLIGFLFLVTLVWLAFLILPCAKPKGQWKQIYVRQKNEEDYETNEEADCFCCTLNLDKGGRLKGFMIYDVLVFVFCLIIFFGMFFFLEKNEPWQERQILYLTKTIYGLLMFPFILFVIPQFNEILTRSRETGYDKYGNCVPRFIEDPKKKQQRMEKNRQKMLEQLKIDDLDYDQGDQQNQNQQNLNIQ